MLQTWSKSIQVLEYAAPVWHNGLSAVESNQLERIQKRALRIILGAQYTSYSEALTELGLLSLADRRHELCVKFATTCAQSERCLSWFPMNSRTHGMNLRRTNTYQERKFRTDRYGNSAIPSLTRLLNQN